MSLKRKRNPAYTVFVKNESGFTFATLLLTLVIILLMLPVFSLLLQIIRFDPNHSQVDAQQFFHYINEEALIAETVEIDQSKNLLHFRVESENNESIDRSITYKQHKNYIRRDKKNGHEIYIRQIDTFKVTKLDYGFRVTLLMENGETYEKTIAHGTTK